VSCHFGVRAMEEMLRHHIVKVRGLKCVGEERRDQRGFEMSKFMNEINKETEKSWKTFVE